MLGLFTLFLLVACSDDPSDPPVNTAVDMVSIPAGTFRMGDIRGIHQQPNELPVHTVGIAAFRLSRHEITQEVYQSVMGENPSHNNGERYLPVDNVSWYQAIDFCNKLSVRDGYTPCYSSASETDVACDFSANGYRLPTEAEWEYACRAGTETDYFTGNAESDLDRAGWHIGNSANRSHPVGQKEANAFGVYDMHGNVVEWCWDWYNPGYYGTSPSDNPTGPVLGNEKVQRGGSYFSWPFGQRSSFRGGYLKPSLTGRDLGFRVARKQ